MPAPDDPLRPEPAPGCYCSECQEVRRGVREHNREQPPLRVESCTIASTEPDWICQYCGGEQEGSNSTRRPAVSRAGNVITICGSCRDHSFFYCEECDLLQQNQSYHSEGICRSCAEGAHVIRKFDYRPPPIFHDKGKIVSGRLAEIDGKNYFGVELEVELEVGDINDGANYISLLIGGAAYLKEDGSLSNGFELVTHPMTLNHHIHHFEWDKVMKALKDHGFKSHDTKSCGLHVHFGRHVLSQTEQVRLAVFLYSNQGQFEAISRRLAENTAFAKFKSVPVGRELDLLSHRDRYEALNFINSKTIEFRLFRGTLIASTLKATLEFCDSVIGFVKKTSTQNIVGANAWRRYLKSLPKKRYKYLRAYLNARFSGQAFPNITM